MQKNFYSLWSRSSTRKIQWEDNVNLISYLDFCLKILNDSIYFCFILTLRMHPSRLSTDNLECLTIPLLFSRSLPQFFCLKLPRILPCFKDIFLNILLWRASEISKYLRKSLEPTLKISPWNTEAGCFQKLTRKLQQFSVILNVLIRKPHPWRRERSEEVRTMIQPIREIGM